MNKKINLKQGVFLRDTFVGIDVVDYDNGTTKIQCMICKPFDMEKTYNQMEFAAHLLQHVEANELKN